VSTRGKGTFAPACISEVPARCPELESKALNIGLYFLVFCYLGSICMYVLSVTNPAFAAKSYKPLL